MEDESAAWVISRKTKINFVRSTTSSNYSSPNLDFRFTITNAVLTNTTTNTIANATTTTTSTTAIQVLVVEFLNFIAI